MQRQPVVCLNASSFVKQWAPIRISLTRCSRAGFRNYNSISQEQETLHLADQDSSISSDDHLAQPQIFPFFTLAALHQPESLNGRTR